MRPGASTGPAPHARGIQLCHADRGGRAGVSPAHAENTPHVQLLQDALTGQPRTCGEYSQVAFHAGQPVGLAPHMRGIRLLRRVNGQGEGVSPAHAGNTSGGGARRRPAMGQPRTCGEYVDADTDQHRRTGSAPLARGIPNRRRTATSRAGVSPACAGNTRATGGCRSEGLGQPRLRREYPLMPAGPGCRVGSAPRVRGILVQDVGQTAGNWISPACAGIPGIGSFSCPARRISPACAGNTASDSRPSPACTDQPRTCGEYSA